MLFGLEAAVLRKRQDTQLEVAGVQMLRFFGSDEDAHTASSWYVQGTGAEEGE